MVVVAHTLRGRFALKLGKGHHNVEHGSSHRRGSVELLVDGQKFDIVFTQKLPNLAEIREGAAEAVQPVHDDFFDAARLHRLHELAESRPLGVFAGKTLVRKNKGIVHSKLPAQFNLSLDRKAALFIDGLTRINGIHRPHLCARAASSRRQRRQIAA